MEEENAVELLQRYRRDRRVLLNFILSGSLIKKVVMPPGAVSLDDVDLDQVSTDHVLNCAKKGGMLELSEAIRDYHDSTFFPATNDTGSTDEFFLVTDPESSGPPPRRAPPSLEVYTPSPIMPSLSKSQSLLSTQHQEPSVDDIDDFEDDDYNEEVDSFRVSRRSTNEASDLALSLPSFATGITDDNLHETAYEILLASAGAAGGLIVPLKEKKKDKKNRLIRKLARSKSDHVVSQSQHAPGLTGLLETMRVQLEISEAMDMRTRQGLLNALVGKAGKRMDTLLIPLELVCCISRTEFSDKKAYLRWQKRQLNMLEEGLINHPAVGFGESGRKASELRSLLMKIDESESLPSSSGELQRAECLRSLREIAIPLAERPVRGDLTGEVCHWADGYHLNVKLYEKLLFSVFDILDEGKLTEEVEEILELIKSTWKVLGITETIHYTCYAWVLFHQYVITGERGILEHAIEQMRKIPLKEQRGQQERLHLKNLSSKVEGVEGFEDLTFLLSFLRPIQKWADKQLGDYHLHFAENAATMEEIVTVAILARRLLLEEPELAIKFTVVTDEDQIESYISSSMKNAFSGILEAVETTADSTHEHPLASLAEETKKLLKKDSTVFMPILSQWDPRATAVSASLVHKLYGHKLKPFLDAVEHLTEDVVSVFPAADSLEQYVMALITSACEEEIVNEYCRRKLTPYQVESISGTLVLRWVNAQLGRMLGWVERATQQEHWEPISPQQRHGSSIVEVYRIVEETVDQFFALKVPMRPGELNSLFRGIDNAFQVYTNHITDMMVNKEDLVPPVPILTRYRKEIGIKAFVKKELFDPRLPDVRRSTQINVLTTPKLCVQLNTLHYAISQLNKLEDNIREQWARKRPRENFNIKKSVDENSKHTIQKDPFNGSRKDINAAIDGICEFTGRFASKVLLDGGSSPLFTRLNKFIEEDLEVLKEFFISGGDGLPRGTVENQVSHLRHVIKLLGCETRVLIDDLKSASSSEVQGNRSKLGADSQTLLRILCHRCDSEASQFLKKQYKIPKSAA
ncbi:hypothetical protein IFM89_036057 [Coptis chinensis]|uniref:MHD1 domain-containing protein n=1 Tax=Coptis chinensis TaxID=261450 RepID=A0A835HAQ8_9MAGN|nr:hypothetical protein IFM89_036057 [Coptis chinensis]